MVVSPHSGTSVFKRHRFQTIQFTSQEQINLFYIDSFGENCFSFQMFWFTNGLQGTNLVRGSTVLDVNFM